MAEFFGDLERLAADLYPYRWPIAAGFLLVLAAAAFYAYRRGLHRWAWRHRLPVGLAGAPLLALAGFVAYDLGSPLFIDKTVEEEFPFAFNAVVPSNLERSDVEMIMSGMAAIDQEMTEAMPTGLTESIGQDGTPGVAVALKSGRFRDADSFHRGSGLATIYAAPDGTHLLRLETLDVTNGPDLHVLLSAHADPMSRSEVKADGYVDLGQLKGNRGSQNYPIPHDVDVAAQWSVVIYCKPFSVIFSVAPLEEAG